MWRLDSNSTPRLTTAACCAALGLALTSVPLKAADDGASTRPASFDCLIEPSAVVELAAPVAGVVSEMLVDRGDRVVRGQSLARLEDRLERAAVAVARQRADSSASVEAKRARLAFEERRLSRNERLIDGNIITAKEADEIKTAHEVAIWELREAEEAAALARLQLAQAEADLSLREIKSTVDGVVIERNREPGETTAGEHLVRIAKLNPLYVETFVPATMIGNLSVGTTARVVPENGTEHSLQAKVQVIDQVADAASGMVKVRMVIDNPDYRELSGLRCSASLDGAANPQSASGSPVAAKP
jgi:RND family efflux transporter MFP subunit